MMAVDYHGVRLVDAVDIIENGIILTFDGEKADAFEEVETKNEEEHGY